MISSAIRYRYGHGAAHLPIGPPIGSTSLSETARNGTRAELPFSLSPTILCLALAGFLAGASLLGRSVEVDAAPPPISIALWDERPPISPLVEAPAPEPARVTPAPGPTTASPEPIPTRPEPAAGPFDPRALLVTSTAGIDVPAPRPDAPTVDLARPAPGPRATHPIPDVVTGWSQASSAPDVPGDAGAPDAPVADPSRRDDRPRAATSASTGSPVAGWSTVGDRRAFLAGLESDRTSGAGPDPTTGPRPQVAAAASIEAERSLVAEARRTARAEGWREVPLDALPDCSPPGRQDLLKQQILRAAAARSECTSLDGRFRFLETRNLNAFLMWSRSPSTSSDTGRTDRGDACVVLEEALRCLSATIQ